jgi:hypothetical protein
LVLFEEYNDRQSVLLRMVIPYEAAHTEAKLAKLKEERQAERLRLAAEKVDTARSVETDSTGNSLPETTFGEGIAEWEEHTRGIGSKLLASMGYRRGGQLGAKIYGEDGKSQRAEALRKPIEIRVLPPGRSLDFISEQPKKHKHKKTAADRTTDDMFAFLNVRRC